MISRLPYTLTSFLFIYINWSLRVYQNYSKKIGLDKVSGIEVVVDVNYWVSE